jgi:hypothetical protein
LELLFPLPCLKSGILSRDMSRFEGLEQHEPQYGDSAYRKYHSDDDDALREDARMTVAKPDHGGADKAD